MVGLAKIKRELKATGHTIVSNLAQKKQRIKAARPFHVAADALVLNASAFSFGVVQGRTGGYKIGGAIPIEVLLGLGFHAAGIMDAGGEGMSRQLHNIGNGALAAYTSSVGWNVGRKWATGRNPGGLKGISDGIKDLLTEGGEEADKEEGGGTSSPEDLIRLAKRM